MVTQKGLLLGIVSLIDIIFESHHSVCRYHNTCFMSLKINIFLCQQNILDVSAKNETLKKQHIHYLDIPVSVSVLMQN